MPQKCLVEFQKCVFTTFFILGIVFGQNSLLFIIEVGDIYVSKSSTNKKQQITLDAADFVPYMWNQFCDTSRTHKFVFEQQVRLVYTNYTFVEITVSKTSLKTNKSVRCIQCTLFYSLFHKDFDHKNDYKKLNFSKLSCV